MGFCISNYGCPRVTNYEDAVKHLASIKPIRGTTDLRPIGDRRKQHLTIHEGRENGVHYVALRLYSSDVIKYYADKRIEVDVSYNSQSTAAFADYHAAYGRSFFLSNNRICCWVSNGDGTGGSYATRNGHYEFNVKDNGVWELLRHDRVGKVKVNRSKAAEVRKLVKPCIQFCESLSKVIVPGLVDDTYHKLKMETAEEVRRKYPQYHYSSYAGLALSDDSVAWTHLMLSYASRSYGYNSQTRSYESYYDINMEALKQYIYSALYKDHDALYFEPSPDGVLPARDWVFAEGVSC